MTERQAIARQVLELMDLTSLNQDDTDARILNLCQKADTPAGFPAAICIYPQFISLARCTLDELDLEQVRVATVANFPHGRADIDEASIEVESAVQAGADEVDVVFPYRALMDGDLLVCRELVSACKAACGDGARLKVILESGVLSAPSMVRQASELAIVAGADFIKTSTGKVEVSATLEAADVMLRVIRDSERRVGFKASGGIRDVSQAAAYLKLAADIMGPEWISADNFRFGASGLLDSVLITLGHEMPAGAQKGSESQGY